jgi:hypothetical protein
MGNPLVRFCEGPRYNRRYGCDIVAPPGNQAANGENKLQPVAMGGPRSTRQKSRQRIVAGEDQGDEYKRTTDEVSKH